LPDLQLITNLKLLRRKHNLTQDDLGRILSISRQAYSNYETGKREPDLSLLVKLSAYYEISIDQLVYQTLSPYPDELLIRERKGPYTTALDCDTSNTLQVNSEEVNFLMRYRMLSPDDKRLIDRILEK
jgi:transcriptional regulator with XRE-family HTH domain